jgi:hypothetical protein
LLALQRAVGNKAVSSLVQPSPSRYGSSPAPAGGDAITISVQRLRKTLSNDAGGEVVQFDTGDELPDAGGKLASDPGFYYTIVDEAARKYKRRAEPTKKGGGSGLSLAQRLRREQIAALKTRTKELFDPANRGGEEGSFEYVANYLYAQVFELGASEAFWNEAWEVDETTDPPQKRRRQIPNQRDFLQRMIDRGLDAAWTPVPVKQIVSTKLGTRGEMPGKKMPVVEPDEWDVMAAKHHTGTGAIPTGVGFHCTDGSPDRVLKSKAKQGWGGITRPITVPLFQTRYALDAPWNPLKAWLDSHAPTFRLGVNDNELLSTVSVATDIHASVRFPLANKNRPGEHHVQKKGEDTFHMRAYVYAVAVDEGYLTFLRQGNPMGEIATSDIPIERIIGWAPIDRWHSYRPGGGDDPETGRFWYTVGKFELNPEFPTATRIHTKLAAAAKEQVDAERVKSGDKYNAAAG